MFDEFEGFGGAGGAATNEALANTGSSYRLGGYEAPASAPMIQPAPAYSPGTLEVQPQRRSGFDTASNVANAVSKVQDGKEKEDGGGLQKILGLVGTVAAFL